MKRFWRTTEAVAIPGGFAVHLDGKPVRLPGGDPLVIGNERLAEAVAVEWDEAGDEFNPQELRLTRLAGTAQDRIAPDAEPVAMALARYAESDLLCYWAERPAELVERQRRSWQPWLDWAQQRFGARLVVARGVRHVPQDSAALAILAGVVAARGAATIAGLGVLVPALGSLVLALAVVDGALSADEAFALSILDESFQVEQWGDDPAAAARRREVAEDVLVAARFVELSRT